MESRFKIEARGSTPTREAIGGITTFLAMAYIAVANPAILAEAGVPFTYSIANGIGFGFVSHVAIMALTGRAREVKPLMWVSAFAFLVMFVFG